jgi:hypothetical protein
MICSGTLASSLVLYSHPREVRLAVSRSLEAVYDVQKAQSRLQMARSTDRIELAKHVFDIRVLCNLIRKGFLRLSK